jgi:response regulator RpfG family c-di-GMP phosphodiesterase
MAETKKLGERLIEAGLITRDALTQALELQKSKPGVRLGDCLLSLGLVSEQALLRFLAAEYQTRYVSADKLAKVKIATEVLDRIPVRFAEAQALLPILYDAERKALSVVMAEPQNRAAIEELKILAGLSEVYAFIGTRSAIQAAIRKHYYSDPTAFDVLSSAPVNRAEAEAVAAFVENTPTTNRSVASASLAFETSPAARMESLAKSAAQEGMHATAGGVQPSSVRLAVDLVQRSSLMSDNDFIDTLNVLVGLIEMRRRDAFRARSAAVAKHSRTIAQRMGLPVREVNHITIAAYLHDLAKRADRHLTLLSAAENSEWKLDAKRYYKAPIKLFETVHLPNEVNAILAQLFEAYDGSGLPQGLKAEAIPAGARILAAVDSYEDLTKNIQNVWGKVFSKAEALARLQSQVGTLFDPAVVDLMRQIHTGEILRNRIVSEGRQALICHADEGMRTDLRDALGKLGLAANVTLTSDAALDAVRHGEADLLLAEVGSQPEDAFAIVAALRQEPATAGLPVIFLAEKDDPSLCDRASGLRPAEVVVGSVDPDEIAAKAKALLDDRVAAGAPGRPVSGTLDEMQLPELLKTIAEAKRSGRLVVRGLGKSGEVLVEQGRVVHATCPPAKGEDAFDQLLEIKDGDFTLDPNFLILEQQMDKDVDVLLREAEARRKRASRPMAPHAAPATTTQARRAAPAK